MTVNQLTKERKTRGITQKQLSKLLKKTDNFICLLEGGKRTFDNDLQGQILKIFKSKKWVK